MTRDIRFIIAYDGTDFHGWQRQLGVRTVQEVVEQTLQRVARQPIILRGASRTDAGVHAFGQVACFQADWPAPLDNLRRAVTHRLPKDVTIVKVDEAPPGFHPSRSAVCKLYRYRVFNAERRPVEQLAQRYTWHFWPPLDTQRLSQAAALLVGTHDFAGFATAGVPRATTVRTINRFDVQRVGDELWFDVEGDGFLYNQIRNMVGTLIEIGRGHWPIDRIRLILDTRDRQNAGPTAPPQGLALHWIRYEAPEPRP